MTARSRTARQIRATIRAALHAGRALITAARGRRYRTLVALYRAIDGGQAVRIAYTDEDGQQTARTIQPERLWISDKGHIMCTAHDQLRQDRRTFRTDRMTIQPAKEHAMGLHVPAHNLQPGDRIRLDGTATTVTRIGDHGAHIPVYVDGAPDDPALLLPLQDVRLLARNDRQF